jgi:hypothetical protein
VVTDLNLKKMPLDPEPSDEGTFVKLRVDPDGDKIVSFIRGAHERAKYPGRLYTSHFATCPDAKAHRR